MRLPAVVIVFFLLLSITGPAYAAIRNEVKAEANSGSGGNASVSVDIENNINGTSKTTTTTTGSTSVEIHQTGDGTSSVKINGKEWKVEGPGDISVREGTTSAPSSSPTPTDTSSPSATPTPTDSDEESTASGFVFIEVFVGNMEKMREAVENLLSSIFGN